MLTPGGSSSGIGIGGEPLAAIVGTETSGSILSPGTNDAGRYQAHGGLISRDGIIPITADQDTAGPMARRWPTRRSCSACSRARRPTHMIRRRIACAGTWTAITPAFSIRDGLEGRAHRDATRFFYFARRCHRRRLEPTAVNDRAIDVFARARARSWWIRRTFPSEPTGPRILLLTAAAGRPGNDADCSIDSSTA